MRACLRRFGPMVVVGVLPVLSGCVAAWVVGGAAAVGVVTAVTYSRGTARATLNAPIFQSDIAVRNVCSRIPLTVQKRETDNDGYRIEYVYRDLQGIKVRFWLKRRDPTTTRILIRVGTLGDKATSMEILAAIEEELQNILPAM